MEYYLGVDIGTSSVKALALGPGGESLGTFRKSYSAQTDAAGRHEEDPEVIVNATLTVVKTLIDSLTDHAPACIAFSAAMHGLLVLDGNGRPLTPLITWADTRAAGEALAFKETTIAHEVYQHTGTPIHPMTPLCKLFWLKAEHPGIFSRASVFVSIKEYVWYRLFGVYEIDRSIASATGLFDTQAGHWYAPALQAAGIRKDQLSLPVPVTHSRRGVHPLPSVPIIIGGGDGCLANLGSGVVSLGEASVTIGTSGAVRVVTPLWQPESGERLFQYWLSEGAYVRGGATNNGGNILEWATALTGQSADAALKEAFALPEDAGRLLFLPYLNGERAPLWDASASGAFIGLRSLHGKAHLLRAVTQGIVFSLYDIFRILDAETPIRTIYASGGFTRSEAWVQQLSDIFGRPVVLTEEDDASAAGAALLGMLALGVLTSVSEARRHIRPGRTFQPSPDKHLRYQQDYTLFHRLYPVLRDTMHELRST